MDAAHCHRMICEAKLNTQSNPSSRFGLWGAVQCHNERRKRDGAVEIQSIRVNDFSGQGKHPLLKKTHPAGCLLKARDGKKVWEMKQSSLTYPCHNNQHNPHCNEGFTHRNYKVQKSPTGNHGPHHPSASGWDPHDRRTDIKAFVQQAQGELEQRYEDLVGIDEKRISNHHCIDRWTRGQVNRAIRIFYSATLQNTHERHSFDFAVVYIHTEDETLDADSFAPRYFILFLRRRSTMEIMRSGFHLGSNVRIVGYVGMLSLKSAAAFMSLAAS